MAHRTEILRLASLVAALAFMAACGSPPGSELPPEPPEAGPDASSPAPDVGASPDAGLAAPDASEPVDAASPDAGAPDASATPDGGPPPMWFVHLTDTHFGTGSSPPALLTAMLEDVAPTMGPVATIHTGDLVDDGGQAAAWTSYAGVVDAAAPPFPLYLEIPGNHDVKNGGAPSFLATSWSGRAGAGMFGVTLVPAANGPVRIVRVNTSDSTVNAVNVMGIVGQAQADALRADPAAGQAARATIIAAHHPVAGLQRLSVGGELMDRLIDDFGAAVYLCGHTHYTEIRWHRGALSVQSPTFGKNGSPASFSLVAIDAQGPVTRLVELDSTRSPAVAWPVPMITVPADASLGGTNPNAVPVLAGSAIDVRVLAFAPSAVTTVEARFGQAPWSALAHEGGKLWAGKVQGLGVPGTWTLEARAVSPEGTGYASVAVEAR